MSHRLDDKVALITGAARGQGKAEAELFAAEGATVIVTDVLNKQGNEVVDEITQNGDAAEYHELDVTEESNWESVVETVVDTYGSIDVLVNNAGVLTLTPLHELTVEEWEMVIEVDQKGVFLGMKHVIPVMLENGGSIVNTSSIWGAVGTEGAAAYQAAKGAVRTMTKNAAITYADGGVRVNSIHPGLIDTPMVDDLPDVVEAVSEQTPVGRPGTTEEVAQGALFLASDEASFITGEELFIDGGLVAK